MNFRTETENQIELESIEQIKSGEICEYLVKIVFKEKVSPKKYSIIWEEELIDYFGLWTSLGFLQHNITPDWGMRKENSRTASGIPLFSAYNKQNDNRITVALSDPMNPTTLAAGIIEETGRLKVQIDLFSQLCPATKEYQVIIRVDKTQRPFYKSIMEAREWWKSLGYKCAYVPEYAKLPMYSCWYSFHQRTIADEIVEECKLAKEYGMDTVIVDDGWQTDDNSRGYAFCGDWEICKEKIPDMKNMVDRIHDLGMKFIIWFSVPFVGCKSKNYERFKGKFLRYRADCSTAVLDPRFKEVREFLTDIYANYVEAYGWDGLKLDFIDSFMLEDISPKNYEDMDTVSIEEGVEMLLSDVTERLKKINPDIMLEFRQSYVGPAISKYGNIFRAMDCPADPIYNRLLTLNLRLTSDETAVHSDMLMWNNKDTNESVMYQLLAVMFAVPQISVMIENITDDHRKILKAYLDFWKNHRDILLNGELSVCGIEANYTMAQSKKDGTCVSVLYQNVVKALEKDCVEYIFNSTGDDNIYIESDANREYEIYDYFGNVVSNGTLSSKITSVPVKNCYMIKILK